MNGLSPLRAEPARHPIGRGWVWVRSGFDVFNKGMGVSVAMVLIWFAVGLLLERLPAGGLISQLLYMVWGAGWMVVAQRGYEGNQLKFADFFAGFRNKLTPLMLGGLLVAERLQGWSFYADLNLWLGSGSRFNASLAAVLLLYGLAAWLNRLIPDSGVRYPSHAWHVMAVWQRFKQDHLKLWRDPLGSISLSVTTLFWGVGATLQLLVLAWAQAVLHLSLEQAAYLQGATALGVIAGAALAARTVSLQQAPKVLMVGMLLGALLPLMAWVQSTEVAMALTFVLGLVGGFFVVPMNAMLQHRGAQLLTAGRSISVQNVNENTNILVMMGIYSGLLHAGISVVDVSWLLGAAVFLGMAAVQWRYWKYVRPSLPVVKAA